MKRFLLLCLLPPACVFAQTEREKEPASAAINTGAAISVTVGGAFPLNGTFQASPLERVDQYITRTIAAALPRQAWSSRPTMFTGETVDRMTDQFARRNILLKRISGKEMYLDLERFRLTGDFKDNPYLKNDDVLVFPAIDTERDFVSISGAVNRPIRFQFVNGDRLSDAILFAGGLNASYDSINTGQLSRLDNTGQVESLTTVVLQDNPELRRGDRLFIRVSENEKRDFRVYVTGEVESPGAIPISKSNTTLREVIKRAGGFRPSADLSRAELVRGANVFQSLLFTAEFERMLMMRMAVFSPEDTLSFAIDNGLRVSRGNGLIDFSKVTSDSSQEGDFDMRDNDLVFVPERAELVYVYGQVSTPGYIQHRAGEPAEYYLQKAGGIAESAKGPIYLIKGKSRSWVEIDDARTAMVEPGDFLWIPRRLPRDFDYYLLRVGSVAATIAALATVILLIQK